MDAYAAYLHPPREHSLTHRGRDGGTSAKPPRRQLAGTLGNRRRGKRQAAAACCARASAPRTPPRAQLHLGDTLRGIPAAISWWQLVWRARCAPGATRYPWRECSGGVIFLLRARVSGWGKGSAFTAHHTHCRGHTTPNGPPRGTTAYYGDIGCRLRRWSRPWTCLGCVGMRADAHLLPCSTRCFPFPESGTIFDRDPNNHLLPESRRNKLSGLIAGMTLLRATDTLAPSVHRQKPFLGRFIEGIVHLYRGLFLCIRPRGVTVRWPFR
jgi:hypothetical protein